MKMLINDVSEGKIIASSVLTSAMILIGSPAVAQAAGAAKRSFDSHKAVRATGRLVSPFCQQNKLLQTPRRTAKGIAAVKAAS